VHSGHQLTVFNFLVETVQPTAVLTVEYLMVQTVPLGTQELLQPLPLLFVLLLMLQLSFAKPQDL
jgi:hypothetical protein